MISVITADGKAERQFLTRLRSRGEETGRAVTASVSKILDSVRKRGDAAVRVYTKRYDGVSPRRLEVPEAVVQKALKTIDPALRRVLERAAENIRVYHEKQRREGYMTLGDDTLMGQIVRPLSRAGLYVPGGTAAYPSSVLMNAIPARVAGVEELIMCSPPGPDGEVNPRILAAAAIAGVDRVFRCGGAQAVAAMAYGTKSIPQVDKIVGPGNIYVATAKRLVFGTVDIDMIAGPSEILIVADGTADPAYLAADMLSQAEHDRLASSILLCTDPSLPSRVLEELEKQLSSLPRQEIARESLAVYGGILVVKDLDEAVRLANELAPEHLELMTDDPLSLLSKVKNAGSVFLGHNTPEPLGDYMAGPNHILPTGGTARFFSPLSVDSFVKKMSYLRYGRDALRDIGPDVIRFAEEEGLSAHANSVKVRLEK